MRATKAQYRQSKIFSLYSLIGSAADQQSYRLSQCRLDKNWFYSKIGDSDVFITTLSLTNFLLNVDRYSGSGQTLE